MRRLAFLLPALGVAGLGGCVRGDGGAGAGEAPSGRVEAAIINGQPDDAHDAVVALLGPEHSCSGTIVAIRPPYLYVLTAAHCVAPVAPTDPEVVAMGPDYQSPDVTFPIESCQPHPDYDGQSFDFAMCRALGASAATPVIAVQSEPDQLEVGVSVRHVGYGVTEADGSNSLKYSSLGRLSEVDELLLWYDQANTGPCFGDSGGPQLTATSPELLVGVTSFGDESCTDYGASGRASRVLDSFIAPFVAAVPSGSLGCGPYGGEPACQTGSGGGSDATGGGAGAADPKDDGLGVTEDSGAPRAEGGVGSCSIGLGPHAGGAASAVGGVLGVALGLTRRRARRDAGSALRRG
jgi:hypothetical protein